MSKFWTKLSNHFKLGLILIQPFWWSHDYRFFNLTRVSRLFLVILSVCINSDSLISNFFDDFLVKFFPNSLSNVLSLKKRRQLKCASVCRGYLLLKSKQEIKLNCSITLSSCKKLFYLVTLSFFFRYLTVFSCWLSL